MKLLSHSPRKTQQIAGLLARTLMNKNFSPPHIFALKGNLGAGKTVFVQGIGKALKIKQKILSPTFVILKEFPLPKNANFEKFYHIDCYRLEKAAEIAVLDFKKIIQNPKNLIFIEWPEKIKKLIPQKAVWIEFKVIDKRTREIIIK